MQSTTINIKSAIKQGLKVEQIEISRYCKIFPNTDIELKINTSSGNILVLINIDSHENEISIPYLLNQMNVSLGFIYSKIKPLLSSAQAETIKKYL